MRETDSRAYEVWMQLVPERVRHDMWIERAEVEQPYKLARRGQTGARIGLVAMAVLAGYAIYADHPWVAALFGALDFVGVVAAFQDNEKQQEPPRSGGSRSAS